MSEAKSFSTQDCRKKLANCQKILKNYAWVCSQGVKDEWQYSTVQLDASFLGN